MTIEFESIKDSLELVNAKPGKMYVYKNDQFVSKAIRTYGEYCHAEVDMLKPYITKGSLFVDVGVNIGYQSLAIHKETECNVIGFEPHPKHFCVAAENCKDLPIQLFNAALGSRNKTITISDFDTESKGNYGEAKQIEEGLIEAQSIMLDSLNIPEIAGMKIDVEGFEYEVMRGAEKTIDKYRPVILYEALNLDWTNAFDFLDHKGYKQYWLGCFNTPTKETFIPKNKDNDPGFGTGGVSNILAIPNEKPQVKILMPVKQDESYIECSVRMRSYVTAF